MIVSALVVTLSADPLLRAVALQSLQECPGVTLGEPVASRLPLVAETESSAAGARLCEELAERAGVLRVDVVAIDFGDEAAGAPSRAASEAGEASVDAAARAEVV